MSFYFVAQLRVLNTLSALAGRDIVYRMAADIRRFRAGMFCMHGWLFQTSLLLNWQQVCLMLRKVPITCRLIENSLPQATQMENRVDSNTRKVGFFSSRMFSSFSVEVVVSQCIVDLVVSILLSSSLINSKGSISSTTGTIPPFFVIGWHEGEGKRLHCIPVSHIDGIAWTPIIMFTLQQ